MQLLDVLRIAVRMLWTNWLRSLLTVLGIGVAISFIVVLIGLGYGLQSTTIGSIVRSKALLSLDVTAGLQEGQSLSAATLTELSALPDVTASSPVIVTNGQLAIDTELAAVAVTAANQTYLEMEGVEITTGQAFKNDSNEVVVSPQLLELLNLQASQVIGRTVRLSYTDPNNENENKSLDEMTIVGVTSPTDAPAVYLPYSLMIKTGEVKLTSIKLVATDRDAVVSLRNQIMNKGYEVASLVETLDQAKRIFGWATAALATFGTIALIVASIGMFNTLTIALIERTREIGIMKAIGVTDRAVKRLFLAEAGIIGLLGGLVGVFIGVLLGVIFEAILNQVGESYQANAVELFQYPPGFLISIIIFPVLISMATGLYPAIRAAKLNPLKALRYE